MKVIVSFMLLATLFVLGSSANAQISTQEIKTIENALVQAMQTARTTALKDADGKITKMDIDFLSRRQQVQLDYENTTLSTITW